MIDRTNWRQWAAPTIPVDEWTALLPAAGRGSRLGFDKPKILYPVAGRPILDWMLDLLLPHCGHIVFVLSPSGRAPVEEHLDQRIPGRYGIVLQHEPTGMGDAVALGLAGVETTNVVIVWGDQVALRPGSVEATIRLHAGPLAPAITCPTVIRANPYIHFHRDSESRISRLLQAREGDSMPPEGESDTGLFCFQTATLRRLLDDLRRSGQGFGAQTHEFNLLPAIPLAAQSGLAVLTPHLMQLEETVGINTADDSKLVEEFLRRDHVRS